MAGALDMADVRSRFPALKQEQVFLDNAGGSQTLGTVIDSITHYLTNSNVQLGASYRIGQISTQKYNDGFAAGAKYINASEDEIVFGSSTTQLFRNVSYTLSNFAEGDELVVSSIDHEANIASWVDLAARHKLTLRWWTPAARAADGENPNPRLTPESLRPLLGARTRLVTCTHASNILGSVTDVPAITALVRAEAPGALVAVDGVAYAPHRPVDVQKLGVDFYCFSWYKVYGPHVSMLYARRDTAQKQMRSLGHFFKAGATLEEKIGLAGGSYELVQAVPAVLDYLGSPSSPRWAAVEAQEHALQSTFLEYLASRPDVFTVLGEPGPDAARRVPTVSFVARGWGPRALVERVEAETGGGAVFAFRWGAFYSNRLVHELLGLDEEGVIRVSMVHYNTVDEVKGIIAAIDKVVSSKA